MYLDTQKTHFRNFVRMSNDIGAVRTLLASASFIRLVLLPDKSY